MTAALLYFLVTALVVRLARVRWQAGVVLVLLPLAFTGRALLTGRVYAPIDLPYASEPLNWMKPQYGIGEGHNGLLSDVYSHNIPWKYAVRDAYRHGEFPLWNPHMFAGDVLAAAAQPAPYDPLLLLSLLLPLPNSLTFLASMSFYLAGLGMYLLLRALRLGEIAALGGSAAWMFSTFVAFWIEWPLGATTAWLPMLFFAVRRLVRERAWRPASLLTLVFVLVILAGHPETTLHVVALGALWALAELWATRGAGLLRTSLYGVGAGLAALLLTAIFLFPVMDALPQTYEHELRRTVYRGMKKSADMPLVLAKLEAQLVPFVQGMPHREWRDDEKLLPPLESAWCGSVALVLAVLGAWRSKSRAKWAALALIVVGIAFGARIPPFPDLLGKVPLFDVALNDRLVAAAAFGVALLAALGIDALDRRALAIGSVAVAVVLALACANAWSRMLALGLTPSFLKTQAMILFSGPLVTALIAAVPRRRVACALLFAAIVAQRAIDISDFYPTLPVRAFYPPVPIFDKLPRGGEPFRIVGHYYALIPNTATLYGLEDVRGYQALHLRRWMEAETWSIPQGVWWGRVEDLTNPFLSLLNVRYAISASREIPPGWRMLAEQPGTRLLENTRAFGRAFVPRTARIGLPAATVLTQMRHETDFAQRVWIHAQTTVPREELNGPGTARVVESARGRMTIHASMRGGGWVVISETAWKGWRAFVDGKRAPLRYANHTLLAVYVPQGEHTIRMHYLPQSFVIGAWTSGITLAVLLALYFAGVVFVGTKRLSVPK